MCVCNKYYSEESFIVQGFYLFIYLFMFCSSQYGGQKHRERRGLVILGLPTLINQHFILLTMNLLIINLRQMEWVE